MDTFQTTVYRTAVGTTGHIVLDRPDCQFAAKAVIRMAREPRKLDWMRLLRLAKFRVSHGEAWRLFLVMSSVYKAASKNRG